MKGMIRKGGLVGAAAMVACVSAPAQAAIGCWNDTQVAAAKVRDLQSRLMVATMRCRAMGVDITGAYNRFVVANRTTIQGANGVILAQFRSGFGSDAQRHYDRFATALANAYGGEVTDRWICAETATLAEEAAAAQGDAQRLVALADRLGTPPALPGGTCGLSFDEGQSASHPRESNGAGLEVWNR